jgi:hypothetical protein
MKVIIDGIKYDTVDALAVANHLDRDEETLDIATRLFRTDEGEYFFHAAAGQFLRGKRGFFVVENEQIFPTSMKEAWEWCEVHAPEAVDEHFDGSF